MQKGGAKPPKATTRPYTRHILGIDSGVQSHLKATPKRHQGATKATHERRQKDECRMKKPANPTAVTTQYNHRWTQINTDKNYSRTALLHGERPLTGQ
jgi:hypothetical protein